MDDRAADPAVSLAGYDDPGTAPSRWANGLSDRWERESSWGEPEAMDLLTTLSTQLSLRLGSGLLAEDMLLG